MRWQNKRCRLSKYLLLAACCWLLATIFFWHNCGHLVSAEKVVEDELPDFHLSAKELIEVNSTTAVDQGYPEILKAAYSNEYFYTIGNTFLSFLELPRTITECPPGTTTFVFICTAPMDVDRRQSIRQSWLSSAHRELLRQHGVFAIFLAGVPEDGALISSALQILHSESQEYGDVVLTSGRDSYKTMSDKALAGHAWGLNFCPSAKFHVKVDDDVFLNIPRMVKYIANTMKHPTPHDGKTSFIGRYGSQLDAGYTHEDLVVMGPLFNQNGHAVVRVDRRKESPWYVPRDMYPSRHYPIHANGMFRACTAAFAKACLKATMGQELIPVEDAFIAGVIAERVGARRIYDNHTLNGTRGRWTFTTSSMVDAWAEACNNSTCDKTYTPPVAFNTFEGLDTMNFKKAAALVLADVHREIATSHDDECIELR